MFTYSKYVLGCLTLFIAISCSSDYTTINEQNNTIITIIESNKNQLQNTLNIARAQALAKDNNRFAFDAFKVLLHTEGGQILFSPYSLSESLSAVYAGTGNTTRSELGNSLYYFSETLHADFNSLHTYLTKKRDHVTFDIQNSIWIQLNYDILSSYLDLIKTFYGMDIKQVDFLRQPEIVRLSINHWIKEHTNNAIKELLPEKSVTKYTQIILSNTISIQALWQFPFQKSDTETGTFTLEDNSSVSVKYMKQYQQSYAYHATQFYQAMILPFKDSNTSIMFVLPNKNESTKVIHAIDDIFYDTISASAYLPLNLSVPTFEILTPLYDIKSLLQDLGTKELFTSYADFSHMISDETLIVRDIFHQSYFKIDEKGIDASAATAIVENNISINIDTKTVSINRPFILLIFDNITHQILFIGRVNQPISPSSPL